MIAAVLGAIVLAGGCRPKKEETPTAGSTVVLASQPLASLLQGEAAEYMSLYPETRLEVRAVETREAIVEMLNGGVHAIGIDRPLNPEERTVAADAGMNIVENSFATDALAIIVHADNPARRLSVESVRRIVTHSAVAWIAIPESKWDRSIDLVLTGLNSGPPELLQRSFFHLPRSPEVSARVASQHDAIEYVRAHPSAVTFVSMMNLSGLPSDVRVLPVESTDSAAVGSYVLPTQMNVYQSLYPFHYSLYLVLAESKAAVGAGFSTYVIKTVTGQKAVQNAGLVPVKIPNRVIQLNPE